MACLKIVVSAVAVIAGLVGAVLWWRGSTLEKKNMEAFIHWKLVQDENGKFTHHQDTYPYLERIGWWNKWAAIATGISVIASTTVNFL
ncbi:MAG TPA: hypothetical protein VKW08_00270 [Xanthobacteraceae bacterium]|jgi:hypothetical protein|nr:hypothetical protein [Xanthobacteraceae bacterium]